MQTRVPRCGQSSGFRASSGLARLLRTRTTPCLAGMESAAIGEAASDDGAATLLVLSSGCVHCAGNHKFAHTCGKQRARQDWGPRRARSTRQRTVGPTDTPALPPPAALLALLQQAAPMSVDAARPTPEGRRRLRHIASNHESRTEGRRLPPPSARAALTCTCAPARAGRSRLVGGAALTTVCRHGLRLQRLASARGAARQL